MSNENYNVIQLIISFLITSSGTVAESVKWLRGRRTRALVNLPVNYPCTQGGGRPVCLSFRCFLSCIKGNSFLSAPPPPLLFSSPPLGHFIFFLFFLLPPSFVCLCLLFMLAVLLQIKSAMFMGTSGISMSKNLECSCKTSNSSRTANRICTPFRPNLPDRPARANM